ncbi:serine acetyltransferase [Xinfangfangia sp. D13-10-4-6]|uniref:serine O-acetyltransferase EpsC n=1 Tax=Pseudogemmobacter hezensis TaxID=2737662 RepID=UPI001557300E|nr:serine O-acetyltransferase EpsC [Pseudogemmobacter hezensis]NPD16036.1 serine acetyltransferase [Pseudogemmobacter hezensis]
MPEPARSHGPDARATAKTSLCAAASTGVPHGPFPSAAAQSDDIAATVAGLAQARHDWRISQLRLEEAGPRELPSPERVAAIVTDLRAVLFPMRLGPADLRQENENGFIARTLTRVVHELTHEVRLELDWARRTLGAGEAPDPAAAGVLVSAFIRALPDIRRLLDSDVVAAFRADPAARGVDEVLLCYPGLRALINHRMAHRLSLLGLPLIARLIAEMAHGETGIDIHPGARIGASFFIDHGTGTVIGATAIIGERVQLFQGVTLGAKSFPTDQQGNVVKGLPRHPIIGDDVVIYSGATVLGRVSIGEGSVLGGNVWVTADVPPFSIVSQARVQSREQPENEHAKSA